MKIDDQLKQMFKDPDEKWFWRMNMAREKQGLRPLNHVRKRSIDIIRNIMTEVQSLKYEHYFNEFSIHYLEEKLYSKGTKLLDSYETICEINELKAENREIKHYLKVIGKDILDDVYMQFPESLIPEIDAAGHLYIDKRTFNDDDE